MEWTKLAGDCKQGDCPNVYLTAKGTIAVQGSMMGDVDPPLGEAVVEIPPTMLLEAANVLATR